MKYRSLIIYIIFLIVTYFSYCQSSFQYIIGREHNETAHSIVQKTNGNYIISGHSLAVGVSDIYLSEINQNGTIVWTKTISGPWNGVYNYDIILTSDGGFVVSGQESLFGAGYIDMFILKFNSSGNLSWAKTIGGTETEYCWSVKQVSDGGYILGGYTNSFGAGSNDMYIVKLDANGIFQWNKCIGGTGNDIARTVLQATDNNYVIAGSTTSFGSGNADMYIVKLDLNGNLLWNKTFGGTNIDEARKIISTSDGGCVIAGSTNSFGAGNGDMYIVKIDINGNIQWNSVVGSTGIESAYSIIQTNDGGYAVTGYTNSFGAGNNDILLVKLDINGVLQWTKTVGGSGAELSFGLLNTIDNGYIIAGNTNSFGAAGLDMFIVKFDAAWNTCSNFTNPVSNYTTGGVVNTPSPTIISQSPTVENPTPVINTSGNITPICSAVGLIPIKNELPIEFKLEQNYPNPFNPETRIKFHSKDKTNTVIKIYDALGKELSILINENLNPGTYEASWNAENYSTGIYFYTLQTEKYSETKKMILIK